MVQTLPLEGGGSVHLFWERGMAEVFAERQDDGLGLYKVWLCGGSGGEILVGTLTPEKGRLTRFRRFSIKELEANECWPVKKCRIKLVFPFERKRWYCEHHPENLIFDPVLRRQIKGAMMCCREGEKTFLAVPFRKESPIQLDAVFCFGKVEMVQGILHIVWTFNSAGQLCLPREKDCGSG